MMPQQETRYRLLKLLNENPTLSQRQLADETGVSLGKVNYCLKALIKTGLIKVDNFQKSNNKVAYAYLLTPKGIAAKAKITVDFLKRKQNEYDSLVQEIEVLKQEAALLQPTREMQETE
jgi:EPS-associated MarR family transcriptional regulator